eukprot:GSMAST32.ASY1.ANO1.1211.1 assembled CDS
METGSRKGVHSFDFPKSTLAPDSTQELVYNTIAAPLVSKFCEGFDVDLISYGQTGSGKTFTISGSSSSNDSNGIILPEHGFLLRSGLDSLAAVQRLVSAGHKAVLHGSMIELSILSFTNQSCKDLLKGMAICFVDDEYHLQGAEQMEIKSVADVVKLAAAVETRLTRGTKMNLASSRSHCVAQLKLTVFDLSTECVRESRLQFFDLMGSERFVGQNAAHDTSKSSKATMSGWEGIYSNLSLMELYSSIELAAKNRYRKKPKEDKSMIGMLLTKLLAGSLQGSALTGMITCVSQSPRNGDETYSSLKYGNTMSKLLNKAKPQPKLPLKRLLTKARKQYTDAAAVIKRGVVAKYKAKREAQLAAYSHKVAVLEGLLNKM